MGIKREANGVWKVGGGVTDGNDYKGVADKKSLLIQLTADGATQESMDNLEYLKAYADYYYTLGQPIFPHDISVWLSNNGKTAAIEADDISLEDGVYTICGITCTNGTWDFTNAGQSGGGGSSDLPEVDSDDNGKVLTVVSGSWAAAEPSGGLPEVTSSNNGQVLTVVSGEWAAAQPSEPDAEIMYIRAVGEAIDHSSDTPPVMLIATDKTAADIAAACDSNVTPLIPIIVCVPLYYEGTLSYENGSKTVLIDSGGQLGYGDPLYVDSDSVSYGFTIQSNTLYIIVIGFTPK